MEEHWRNNTEEGHKVFYSGKVSKHEHGIGFHVQRDTVNTVMECCPASGKLIIMHLRAVPFNITVVQAYTPMSGNDDNEIEE